MSQQPNPCNGGSDTCLDVGDAAAANSRLALTLVRTLFVSVGQAIETGNYSVLRDLATPAFRKRYSAAGLEIALAPLRDGGYRLQDAVLLVPRIDAFQREDDDRLRLIGAVPIAPGPLHFDVLFQNIAGSWQLLGFQFSPDADMAAAPGR
ncbi:hypothetical protein [uncultured Aureimonas sp.]|uniref:hypothetical protein n=1 Tax=uncultured Aureimonas sp. TaxID=1604662 RepID=UPI0025D1DD53|nr:hypothetical protein [uncultured Aureimonas sp.]